MCLAVPCRVVEIVGEDPLTCVARVAFGGVVKEISLALLPEAVVDDHVLVHAGFAIARLDEDAARRVEAELDRLVSGGFTYDSDSERAEVGSGKANRSAESS